MKRLLPLLCFLVLFSAGCGCARVEKAEVTPQPTVNASQEVPALWFEIEDPTPTPATAEPTLSSTPLPSATLPAQGTPDITWNTGSSSSSETSAGSSSSPSGTTGSSSGANSSSPGLQRPNTGTSSSSSSSGQSTQNTPGPTQTAIPTSNNDQSGSSGQIIVTPSIPTHSPESSPNYGTDLPVAPTATIPEESLLPSGGLFGEPDTDF